MVDNFRVEKGLDSCLFIRYTSLISTPSGLWPQRCTFLYVYILTSQYVAVHNVVSSPPRCPSIVREHYKYWADIIWVVDPIPRTVSNTEIHTGVMTRCLHTFGHIVYVWFTYTVYAVLIWFVVKPYYTWNGFNIFTVYRFFDDAFVFSQRMISYEYLIPCQSGCMIWVDVWVDVWS